MTEKDYTLDFKWLLDQKQFNAYQNYLQELIDNNWKIFKSDTSVDLIKLQIETMTIERIKN